MVKRITKNLQSCVRQMNVVNGKVTMKFKKTKRCQNAQEVIDSVKTNKIIIK